MMALRDYIMVALVAAIFTAGWQGHKWYAADSELNVLKAINETQAKAATAAADEIAKIKIEQTTINRVIKERLITETVYKDCAHSEDSFNIIKGLFK